MMITRYTVHEPGLCWEKRCSIVLMLFPALFVRK